MSDKKACHKSFIKAAKGNCLKCVKLLMPHNVGSRDKEDKTALIWAAQIGHHE